MANCQLSDLLHAGFIKVGEKVEVKFQNKSWSGTVSDEEGGSLCFDLCGNEKGGILQKSFRTPGQAALGCVRTVNPKQAFVNGWTVSYEFCKDIMK